MLTKIFVESFKFTNSHFKPSIAFKIYDKSITMSLERFCDILGIPMFGTTKKMLQQLTDLLELYQGVTTRAGIDLRLGQKPKLGGRYADDSLIYISYFVGTLYIHVSLSFSFCYFLLLFLLSKTQKRPKIFLLFLFICFFSFLALVCFTCYFWFGIWKIQFFLLCLLFPSVLVSKIKNPKIFVILLQFCKVCCRV
jgi:hypothetical protein